MSTDDRQVVSDSERMERLERSVRWLKIAVALLLVCVLFPYLAAIGFSLLALAIPVGVIAFIVAVMCVLDWLFPGKGRDA